MNISTDAAFVFAIDTIAADVTDDGRLAFEVQLASQIPELGILTKEIDAAYHYEVSAYVLMYEPRVEPPPPGNFGQKLVFEVPPRLEIAKKKKQAVIFDDLKFRSRRDRRP